MTQIRKADGKFGGSDKSVDIRKQDVDKAIAALSEAMHEIPTVKVNVEGIIDVYPESNSEFVDIMLKVSLVALAVAGALYLIQSIVLRVVS